MAAVLLCPQTPILASPSLPRRPSSVTNFTEGARVSRASLVARKFTRSRRRTATCSAVVVGHDAAISTLAGAAASLRLQAPLDPGPATVSLSQVPYSAAVGVLDANSVGLLAELSPQNAELLATLLGPVLAVANVLFIFRIVMSWYPQLPVKEFPYNIAYVPTEPLLSITRNVVQPVGGVDVSPVIWLAFFSFMNEILLGQQGLLILISQQQI